tara:strand:+ start:520 stop:1098 length:579 start_codon:yes stop_codon:yes gene_type:complete
MDWNVKMQHYLASLALIFTVFSTIATGQQILEPQPMDGYQTQYQSKWTALVANLKDRADLSFPEKLALYEREITSLKQQFGAERSKEYQSMTVTLTADHACKGRPSGTAKNCGYKCVERPNENMYTTDDWITYTGDSKGQIKNEAKACLKLEARGSGKTEGRVSAVFKYRTSYIDYKVAKDADELFNSFLAD